MRYFLIVVHLNQRRFLPTSFKSFLHVGELSCADLVGNGEMEEILSPLLSLDHDHRTGRLNAPALTL